MIGATLLSPAPLALLAYGMVRFYHSEVKGDEPRGSWFVPTLLGIALSSMIAVPAVALWIEYVKERWRTR